MMKLDCFVSASNREFSCSVQDAGDFPGESGTRGQNILRGFALRKTRWAAQGQYPFECREQPAKRFTFPPARYLKRREAADHLSVALQGEYRILGPDEHDACAQVVGKEFQEIQGGTLFPVGTGEKMMNLVNDEHAGGHPSQQVSSESFEDSEARGGVMRGTKLEQQGRVESVLVRRRRHLHRDDRAHFDTESLVEFVRMRAAEFSDDLSFADIGVAVQQKAGHALASWCRQ
ncbi:hypothetical protein WS45_28380 [Burkholderia sp. RF2-non_BP3]|nr:hypothetical protein WS45_28380 [Burkholderia sp. RF2-non_BP3]